MFFLTKFVAGLGWAVLAGLGFASVPQGVGRGGWGDTVLGFRNWRWPFLSPPGRPGGLCVRHRVPSLVDRLGRPFHAFLFSHCACPPPPPGEPLCRNMFDNPHIPGGGEFPSCPTFGQPPSRLEARCPEARFAVRKHGRKRSGSTLRKRARRARWSRPPTPRPGLAPYETPLRNLGRRTKGQ